MRAVHIELVEEISYSAFINAVKRLVVIRSQVKIFRSDRGTNFIDAIDDIKIDSINVFKNFLYNSGTTWIFNPPHSSHMGGAWERMIEVSAIINSRSLVPVSTDPENLLIVTPDQLGELDKRDLCLAEWRRVQVLGSVMWSHWRKEYLPLLQQRRQWTEDRRDLIKGDVILLKDKNLCRTQWPIGVTLKSFKGSDEHVRKAEVRIVLSNTSDYCIILSDHGYSTQIHLIVNGAIRWWSHTTAINSGYTNAANHDLACLNEGDKVWIANERTSSEVHPHHTTFSGVLSL
ncbi:Hypothetical predicted protein [Mytilus galloprovincialis]|uniref:DUF5641 domain-containing protein n=1 Tax=Mytilus galloprovincialis TaxID=29158 RepID=A0A8B6D8U5_MYTGA|nr:Hypothetical predicted protein [Mytilus galloprovincialis]